MQSKWQTWFVKIVNWCLHTYFNPRTRVGCDRLSHILHTLTDGFQSTHPCRVRHKRQGDVVAIKMKVTTTANKAYGLGNIPAELVPIPNSATMMRVTARTADQGIGRNLQINGDGSMFLLSTNRGDTFNTQVTWII